MKKYMTLIWLVFVLFVMYPVLFAGTTGKITGTVTDAETGKGIQGARVYLMDTKT